MWLFGVGIIGELVVLAFLSGRLIQLSFLLLLRITRSRTVAITILTILLFPGTVIHELSHLFTAEILGVHTGKLTLTPESIEHDTIQSGSVQIQETDPFRRTIIGIAPTIAGISALTLIAWYISRTQPPVTIFLFYLLLTVSNTMFTSKEDLKGVLPVALTIAICFGALYVAGVRIVLPTTLEQTITTIMQTIAWNLGVVVTINLVGILGITGFFILLYTHQRRIR